MLRGLPSTVVRRFQRSQGLLVPALTATRGNHNLVEATHDVSWARISGLAEQKANMAGDVNGAVNGSVISAGDIHGSRPAHISGTSFTFHDITGTTGVKDGTFPNVNARYLPDEHRPLQHNPDSYSEPQGASQNHWDSEWSQDDLESAVADNVMLTWGASGPAKDLPWMVKSEGIYLYDREGNKFMDWTSQAVCCNFGYDVPKQIIDAMATQMNKVPYVYGGMAMVEVRARLSKLMAEIMPGDITGFLFPSGGSEANEAAIRMARRYTGKQKIMTQYRSYHGGTSSALGATGDFRRGFTENTVTGFVKIFNPQPMGFSWGKTDAEAARMCLQSLEEQILLEGPDSVAAIMLESIVGAGGVLVPPEGYMTGVRALCDKYDILLICDEVMAGFGRTGEVWAFQHYHGLIPDIVTAAKGLTGAYVPMSVVGCREKIKQYFMKEPLGWGATYQAHPVAMACAYECLKFMIQERLPERAKALQTVMFEEIQKLVDTHPTVKAGRAVGLFGCIDLANPDGSSLHKLGAPLTGHVADLRAAMRKNGLIALFRPPLLHCCPPLVITEAELREGFAKLSSSLAEMESGMTLTKN